MITTLSPNIANPYHSPLTHPASLPLQNSPVMPPAQAESPWGVKQEPIADVLFTPTGSPEAAIGLDLDSRGNLWRMTLNGRERLGWMSPQGQYQMANGQQGDIFETRNPSREGLLDIALDNVPHPFIQALRNAEKQRAISGSEIPRLRRIFDPQGITGQGVKIGILDPYEPLELEGVDLKTDKGEPGQAWSVGGHSQAISDIVNDPHWGLAPGATVVDKGFAPENDETLRDEDDINAVRYNMSRTAASLFDDTSKQIAKLLPERANGLRVMSITWGGSFLTTVTNLKESLNEQDESGEFRYPNARRQILGQTINQGAAAQEEAMLNFIAQVFQQPEVQQAHRRYIEATRRAAQNGQIIVVAGGNEHGQSDARVQLPIGAELDKLAQSPYVISVAASDTHLTPGNRADDSLAFFSSWGDGRTFNPTIAAPGQCIYLPEKHDTMSSNQVESGTSFAVPFVCATVALMLQVNPSLTFEQIKQILQQTATMLPGYPVAAQGAGVINTEGAVQSAAQLRQMARAATPATPPDRTGQPRL